MINVLHESLVTLKSAANHPAFRRNGKAAHCSTIYRLIAIGARDVRGNRVHLEVVKCPAGLRTSEEAISRFLCKLNNSSPALSSPSSTTNGKQPASLAAADAELAAMGIK